MSGPETGSSDLETKIEIEKELVIINAVLTNIKQELHEINSFVKTDGSLDVALKNAKESLTLMAEEIGLEVEEPDPNAADEDNPIVNALSRITTEYITAKLKALSHE